MQSVDTTFILCKDNLDADFYKELACILKMYSNT